MASQCRRVMLHVLFLLLAGARGIGLEEVVPEHSGWSDDIAKHFVKEIGHYEHGLRMLFIMPDACTVCDDLRKSINEGNRVRELLHDFTAQEMLQTPSWLQADSGQQRSITSAFLSSKHPQVFFVSPDGKALDAPGPNAADPHFFRNEAELSHAAIAALRLAGKADLADEWDPEVYRHFVVNASNDAVRQMAMKEKKPVLVLLMSRWCRACLHLRGSINKGLQTRFYLEHFVVLYSEGGPQGREWQVKGHDYIPQAHFFDSQGSRLAVHASEKYHYFFSDDETLAFGMRKAMGLVGMASKMPSHSPWASDIEAQSTKSMEPATVKAAAAAAEKPLMVIIWQPYCRVCQALIHKVNAGNQVRELLPNFVFTQVFGDEPMKTWQEPGEFYIPQAYFYNKHGDALDVFGPQEKFKRFFQNEDELADAMKKALSLAGVAEL